MCKNQDPTAHPFLCFTSCAVNQFQSCKKEPSVTHIGGQKQKMVKMWFSTPYMRDLVLLQITETGFQHTNLLVNSVAEQRISP